MQTIQKPRRGRPRKVESYANWMARIDHEVTEMAEKMERQPPSYAWLHPAQRQFVELVINHLRSLPAIGPTEDECEKPEYALVKAFLTGVFERKYPQWVRRKDFRRYIDDIPNGEDKDYLFMLRNCAGAAPKHVEEDGDEE